jgi:hypothetical protein
MRRLLVALSLLGTLSCSDSTEPNVLGSLSFSYSGGGGGTFSVSGTPPSFTAPSTTVSWAVGYTDAGETFVTASRPRSAQQTDLAILRIQRTTAGSEPIDAICDDDGTVACTGLFLLLNFNGNGDTADFFCALTSGTIVVTEISSSRAKGTFSGSGTCTAGTGNTTNAFAVTGGAFDVAVVPAPAG